MPTQPTAVAALPPAPNPDSDAVTFDNDAWNWSSALPNFRSQLNAAASVTYTNAQEAVSAAGAAAAAAASAVSQVGLATAQATIASTKAAEASSSADAASADAGAAAGSATAAANSAAAAAALAGAFVGTSSTLVAIGTGTKSFVTQAGELYSPGVFLIATSQANPANFIFGPVASYDSGTGALVLDSQVTGGAGTFADWNISLAGARGAQGLQGPAGNLSGGQLLGALDELKAASIPSATTTNVWGIVGNSAVLTGAVQIGSFGTAPQAGAKRTLIAAASTPITNSANLLLPGGMNYTTAAGDRLEIYAETTTQHRVSIWKADGTAVTPSGAISSVGATVTADVTLSATSAGYQHVQMAGLGRSIKFPAANTLNVGGPKYFIDNSDGIYPVGLRDNTGVLQMAVGSGGTAFVTLKDNTTVAGVWGISGDQLEPGLVTMEVDLSSAMSVGYPRPVFVALDDNVSIHFGRDSSGGFSAYVVDNSGKVVSAPVSVSVLNTSVPVQAFKVNATQAIVFYGTAAGNSHSAVVLTLTGASPNLSLSVGVEANITDNYSTAWSGEDFRSDPKIAQLSATLYVAGLVLSGNNAVARAIAVSGATVTIGAATSTIAANARSVTTYPLTATTALSIIKNGVSAPYSLSVGVLSVAGTTVTPGSYASVSSVVSSHANAPASVLLSPTKAIVMDDGNVASGGVPNVLTISGTSVAVGSSPGNSAPNTGDMSYAGGGAGRYNPKLWRLNATQAGFWAPGTVANGYVSQHAVLTESSGNVSLSGPQSGYARTGAVGAAGYGQMLPQGAAEILCLRQQLADAAGFGLQVASAKVDAAGRLHFPGPSDTVRDAHQQTPVAYIVGRTSMGDYLLQAKGTQGVVGPARLIVIRNSGGRVFNRGKISIPEMAVADAGATPYPMAVVSANRAVLVGDSIAGQSFIPLIKVVNVEIAA